jgi:Uma2 family endonuclease
MLSWRYTERSLLITAEVLQVVAPADHVPGPGQGRWTYGHYAALAGEAERYEIIDGVLYMAPAPTTGHQGSSIRVGYHLFGHVEMTGLGRVFVAPIDVELAPGVVVQPDVVVVLKANAGMITPSRITGAPDLVVEVILPATAGYDRREKQNAYAQAGVREYWIADPAARTVEVLVLEAGAYRSLNVFRGATSLPSHVVPDLRTHAEHFFA